MTIDISQEDFGTLCVCALRYCHGRRTYMPSLVQQIVMAHFKELSDRDLKVIAEDEQFQSDMSLWGDTCDKVDWENFYKTLRAWQNLADNIGAYEDTADTPQTDEQRKVQEAEHRMANIIADMTPQTESTGSPIGDYRDGVGAWQTDCGWSKPNE